MPKPKANPALTALKKRIAKLPADPGVYRWLNVEGEVLYVGKAKNLKARLKSYVSPDAGKQGPWKESMMRVAADVDVTVVRNELEALLLETNLIKEHRPKYNVLMKDDKNYVYVRFTVFEVYPRVEIVRKLERDGAKCFGPFLSSYELHRILDVLHLLYGFRACAASLDLLNRHPDGVPEGKLRPCTDYHIGQCNGLCAGVLTAEAYRAAIDRCIAFFRGDHEPVIRRARELMQEAAADRKFEKAARLRNALQFIETIREKQSVTDPSGDDADIVGIALLAGKVQVFLFQQRGGKLLHEAHFSLSGSAESKADVLGQFLPQYYAETGDIPPLILVGEDFPDRATLAELLSTERGKRVEIVVPERGKKSQLLELAERNADAKAKQAEAKWESEQRMVDGALEELETVLALSAVPKRIEGYDISHLGGTETSGSMSVFIDGKPANKHYRHFTIHGLKSGDVDDYKSLKEVLRRRLRYLTEDLVAEEQAWKEKGITFGKIRKDERATLVGLLPEHVAALKEQKKDDDSYQYLVVRGNDAMIGVSHYRLHERGSVELFHPAIASEHQGRNLHRFLLRKILRSCKKGKIYISVSALQHEEFAELGFVQIQAPPPFMRERMEFLATLPGDGFIVMMYDVAQHKMDPSLLSRPDLLMIDGGKGQLGVVVDVLKEFGLSIPVIGLAKREEEIFVPGNPVPLDFPKESPARYLLMRLRDEAHRFANRLREMKAKNTLLGK